MIEDHRAYPEISGASHARIIAERDAALARAERAEEDRDRYKAFYESMTRILLDGVELGNLLAKHTDNGASVTDAMLSVWTSQRDDIARLRRQVEAVESKCNIEIASYKGASGNYDSYHEGRSDAGAVILDAMKEAAEVALERGSNGN